MIGRKCVLIAAVSVFGALTVATALSTTIKMLLITRFLTGLGLGGALPNVIALVTESVSVDRRSTAVGFLYASLPAGGAVASLIAAVASGASQWPVVYLAGGVAPASLLAAIAYLVGARPEFAYAVLGGGLVGAIFAATLVACGRSPAQVLLSLLPILGLAGIGALILSFSRYQD